ncbi:MAG: hypothetical protein ACREUE_04955 [Panacagrimonas sp.]
MLFIIGLRNLGIARTWAYFSVAPFFGAAISIAFLQTSIIGTTTRDVEAFC